mmetsp:Transcript_11799/g.35404  ORF Transcript_11799/g.35404 Transcript_11799/m.35404 type:complete len:266 (-) Transcript_11799:513-1310(-)
MKPTVFWATSPAGVLTRSGLTLRPLARSASPSRQNSLYTAKFQALATFHGRAWFEMSAHLRASENTNSTPSFRPNRSLPSASSLGLSKTTVFSSLTSASTFRTMSVLTSPPLLVLLLRSNRDDNDVVEPPCLSSLEEKVDGDVGGAAVEGAGAAPLSLLLPEALAVSACFAVRGEEDVRKSPASAAAMASAARLRRLAWTDMSVERMRDWTRWSKRSASAGLRFARRPCLRQSSRKHATLWFSRTDSPLYRFEISAPSLLRKAFE